jgi:hypothetical protein
MRMHHDEEVKKESVLSFVYVLVFVLYMLVQQVLSIQALLEKKKKK